MINCILLSHVPVTSNNIESVEFSLEHYRTHNPNAYIILTGHGELPKNTNLMDHTIWFDEILPKEINVGHPKLVNIGFHHAKSKGFTKILKTRADTIHLIDDILSFSELKLKNKKILITQQTKINKKEMGDLFLYGDLDFLEKCWDINTWYPTKTGLTSLANNFIAASGNKTWSECLKEHCSFIDIFNLRWIDFRPNWKKLKKYKNQLNNNEFDPFIKYLWGSTEGWHSFDCNGNMLESKILDLYTERTWNESNITQR